MNRKLWIAAAALCLAGAAVSVPLLCNGSGTVIQGLSVDGMKAGGMSREDLHSFITAKNEKIGSRALTVERHEVKKTWAYKDFSVGMNADEETDRILAVGRSGHFLSDLTVQWKALLGGDAERLVISYDEEKVDRQIQGLAAEYGKPPVNSRPVIHGDGSVAFSEGKPYMQIDQAKMKTLVNAQLLSGNEGTVEIPVMAEKGPSVPASARKDIDRVLGVYTTYFSQSPNRSANIERAAKSIDGWLIQPGETFSFNQATGLRTRENGYLDAPVFLDGKLVPDAGGGVCQVSTTLFNAVLLAGLAVTERTCHFGPVAYVPIGQDATVADGYLDFKFQNNLTKPVYIMASYSPGEIRLYILGNHSDMPRSAVVAETDNRTLPHKTVLKLDPAQQEERKTEEGNDGYDVTVVQRVVRSDGSTYSDSFRSLYDAVDTVITFKTKEALEAEKKRMEDAAGMAENPA